MPRSDSKADRGRVQQRIADAISRWCRERVASGRPRFHGAELEHAVCAETGATPGSPLRIFRIATRNGLIEGRCLSQPDSLYELGPSSDSQSPRPASPTPRRSGALPSWECPCGCAARLAEFGITRCFGGAA